MKLETVNGSDLQPRITAAISRAPVPTHVVQQLHPYLYANSVVDMSALADEKS